MAVLAEATDVVDAERIKGIRGKYGLSQRSFAKVLGIGEASMVRYEKGAEPSKANANLIRAAEDPRFVLGCLEREGSSIPQSRRKKAEEYIHEHIGSNADGSTSDDIAISNAKESDELIRARYGEQGLDSMSRVYQYTIRQEVLTEYAANILGDIFRVQLQEKRQGRSSPQLDELCSSLFKWRIVKLSATAPGRPRWPS